MMPTRYVGLLSMSALPFAELITSLPSCKRTCQPVSSYGTGCGAAEARLVWDQEVAGSNPATPTRHNLTGTLADSPGVRVKPTILYPTNSEI